MIRARRYAVLGNPVGHSLSPAIHAEFARQTGEDVEYVALEPAVEGFGQFARTYLAEDDVGGANVTLPFKQQAAELADELDPLAERAGAANTLVAVGRRISAFNTDGQGLVADLRRLQVHLDGSRVLILGAGGAVRGVLQPLLDAGVAGIQISNRTHERARELVASFADGRVEAVASPRLQSGAGVVINATSAGLSQQAPQINPACVEGAVCYDLVYAARPTAFCAFAALHGAAATHDGLGMLVEQAAEAFRIWRGVRPPTTSLIARLRAGLAA